MKLVVFDGVEFWVGENAQDNWSIIDQAKAKNGTSWLWFHLESFPSSHVVLCAKRKNVEKKHLRYAAQLVKDHTTKYSGHRKIVVIYTELSGVRKGNKVGEVFTKKCEKLSV